MEATQWGADPEPSDEEVGSDLVRILRAWYGRRGDEVVKGFVKLLERTR